jgi:signal transduction histidine kinase
MTWHPPLQRPLRGIALASLTSFLIALPWIAPAQAPDSARVLTNASAVLSLTGEEASQRVPVKVTGIVTAAEKNWGGRFFIQDSSGGVFVEQLVGTNQPLPGDVLELSGVSHPGAFAPVITAPVFHKIGTAPLPLARQVPIEQIMSGGEDGQRVEISGIVRAVQPLQGGMDIDLAVAGYRLHVFAKNDGRIDPHSLIGARVRVRGTLAASFNAALRQLVSVVLFVPVPEDFSVEKLEGVDPFREPVLSLNGVAQYRRDYAAGKRVHVKGVVTLQRLGQDFFLQDATGSLHVRSTQPVPLKIGQTIEAVGFPTIEHFLPVLDDAVFRTTTEAARSPQPKTVTVEQIRSGLHHADLVRIQGRLVDRNVSRGQRRMAGHTDTRTVLILQTSDLVFSAEVESHGPAPDLALIPFGSIVEVTGICFTENGPDKKLQSVQILLPRPSSVRVVRDPSWWTPQRLLIGLAALFVFLVVAISWTVMVSKKNARLRVLIREKEKAQVELQQAHDHLEERVRERTEQLKFQITARKESELQFKAVLSERTRLAQELHDTLEQSLTAIALQLDTAAKLGERKADASRNHLEIARNLVSQGQIEVRRSVWDLRSRALEQFDLRGALLTTGKQLADGTNIQFEVSARGRVRPLPETIEDNLLRIAQEAMTNVIKHSGAERLEIELDYGPQTITLIVKDNGRGFDPSHCAGADNGHFGLLGISERAQRLRGVSSINTEPGKGTVVRVQIPLEPADPLQPLPETALPHEH